MIIAQSQPTRLDTHAEFPSHPLQLLDRKPESEPLPAVSLTVGFFGWIQRKFSPAESVGMERFDTVVSKESQFDSVTLNYLDWNRFIAVLLSCDFISLERRQECFITTAVQT